MLLMIDRHLRVGALTYMKALQIVLFQTMDKQPMLEIIRTNIIKTEGYLQAGGRKQRQHAASATNALLGHAPSFSWSCSDFAKKTY